MRVEFHADAVGRVFHSAADGKFLIPVGKKVRIVFARGTAASRGDASK